MLKAINQWCYPAGMSLEKVFEYSWDAGFDAVELNLNPKGDAGLTPDTTEKEAKEIVELASEYHLQLKGMSTALLWKYPLSSPKEEVREEGRSIVKKMIALSETMELDTILVRSEEHTSELQSRFDLVCRLLLEKKKKLEYSKNKYVKH